MEGGNLWSEKKEDVGSEVNHHRVAHVAKRSKCPLHEQIVTSVTDAFEMLTKSGSWGGRVSRTSEATPHSSPPPRVATQYLPTR
jgi:hypothetical protein